MTQLGKQEGVEIVVEDFIKVEKGAWTIVRRILGWRAEYSFYVGWFGKSRMSM